MPDWSPSVSRRAALAGSLLGAGTLAGCRLDGSPGASPSGGDPAAESPDRELMRRVEVQLDTLITLVAAVGDAFAALRPAMQSLEDLHATHRQVLDDGLGAAPGTATPAPAGSSAGSSASPSASPPPSAAPSIPAERSEALALVRVRERAAQAFLVEAAVSAQDAELAQLLASMAAAIGQRLALGVALGPVPQAVSP